MKFAVRGRVLAFVFAASIAASYAGSAFSAQSHLGVSPKDLVTLEWGCNVGTPTRRLTDGTRVENFQIPRKQLLVITDLEWRMLIGVVTPAINYIVEAQLSSPPPQALISHVYAGQLQLINSRGGFRSDHLTSGIVLDASVSLSNDPFSAHPRFSLFGVALEGPAGDCVAILRGYLIKE